MAKAEGAFICFIDPGKTSFVQPPMPSPDLPPPDDLPLRPGADSASHGDEFDWIGPARFRRWHAARAHLRAIWDCGAPADLLQLLQDRLSVQLRDLDDLDATISNLARFIGASRSPTALLALFERDDAALSSLLQVFATSQTLANRLIADPESFDLMRASDGQPAERRFLVDELVAEVEKLTSPNRVALSLRKFVSRELIRVGYGEFVRAMSPEHVGRQLAYIADAVLEAALNFVLCRMQEQFGTLQRVDGRPVTITVIGLGQLGGEELGYGSPLELLFLYDAIEEKNQLHRDYVDQVVRDVVALIESEESSALRIAIDTSFRPLGREVRIASSDLTARRLESDGRTWQRMKLTKGRVVAGDQRLGQQFLARLQPWVYRRFLSRRDFGDISTLRHKLQRRFESKQDEGDDVALAPGGRHDIELMIQFLQLLHGGDTKSVRVGNTARAIDKLERAGCLTHQEADLLGKGYARLCRLQHQLSVMFGHNTSCLPNDDLMRRRLAWHLGLRSAEHGGGDLDRFQKQLQETFELNRRVLNHLMVEAPQGEDDEESFAFETELVLDPDPDPDLIHDTLSRHGLTDSVRAMENIRSLATESVRFLSRRRCHHFLAAIAPALLAEISQTPDPDRTLRTLAQVADSIGGKSSLWELFGANPATMRLMIRVCAATPYLSDILIEMPGMIDELIDSLVMDRLPPAERLDAHSIDLCRRATDIDLVLHGFKNSAHLMVGVRDILGKESVETIHRSLSDTAEACVRRVIEFEQEQLASRFGDPVTADGEPAEFLAVALGKFGGREPNYHSDLDVVFLYTADGETKRRVGGPRKTISNAQFFNQLAAAVTQRVNHAGEFGPLYELDGRLRPTGEEGVLAESQEQFLNRFRRGLAPLWQWLALCKARVISGSRLTRRAVQASLLETLRRSQWRPAMAKEIRDMRMRIQQTAADENLKRGVGGTVDVELIAQILMLRHVGEKPELFLTGTIDSLKRLRDAGLLGQQDADRLIDNYRMLRGIEANLRLMDLPARHELPEQASDLRDLAFLMRLDDVDEIASRVAAARESNRALFESILGKLQTPD